jgi:hypothetical protein
MGLTVCVRNNSVHGLFEFCDARLWNTQFVHYFVQNLAPWSFIFRSRQLGLTREPPPDVQTVSLA